MMNNRKSHPFQPAAALTGGEFFFRAGFMGIGCGLVAFGFDDLEQPPLGIKRNSTDEPEKIARR